MFLALLVIAFVSRTVLPDFQPVPMLHVIFPLPVVTRSRDMFVDSFACRFVQDPFPCVHVSLGVVENSET